MRDVWLAAALALAGCASAPIKKQDVPRLAHADARVLDGCYDCFIEARDTYHRVAVGTARPLLIARLFETQLLIALREKELGLDSALAFGRARELANEMPPLAEAARYLALAEAVPPEEEGTPRRELQEFHRTHAPFGVTVNGFKPVKPAAPRRASCSRWRASAFPTLGRCTTRAAICFSWRAIAVWRSSTTRNSSRGSRLTKTRCSAARRA